MSSQKVLGIMRDRIAPERCDANGVICTAATAMEMRGDGIVDSVNSDLEV